MATPISIQLYTVRDYISKDFEGTLKTLSDIGYSAVEMDGLQGYTIDGLKALLGGLNLKVSSWFTQIPTSDTIGETVDVCGALGVTRLVGGLGPDDFTTLYNCRRSAAKLQEAAALAKAHGFSYSMHNHEWEFKPLPDGRLPFDLLLSDAPDLCSELDIYWAAFGGQDAAQVVARYRSRIELLHVKDGLLTPDRSMTAVGSGKLDMPAIVGAADPTKLAWLIVELDRCETDMIEAVRDSYTYLVGSGLASGNKAV